MRRATFDFLVRFGGLEYARRVKACAMQIVGEFIYFDANSECCKDAVYFVGSPPLQGPGTEIEAIFKLILDDPHCSSCGLRAAQMNEWGVKGCREHRAEIIGWLTEAAKDRGWLAIITAGANAATHGLPLTIGGMVDEAIRRAEANNERTGDPLK